VLEGFAADLYALQEHLVWLVTAAARFRAYLADVMLAMTATLEETRLPAGLLPPFPKATLVD
jgi:hypothetical protein